MHFSLSQRINLGLLLIAGFIFACESDVSDTGRDILPPSDLLEIQFIDTFSLNIRTVIEEEAPSGQSLRQLLGTLIDPVFGRLDADIFTQFSRETNLWDFNITLSDDAENLVFVDSVILTIIPDDFYGEFNSLLNFQVFQIDPISAFPDVEDLNSNTTLNVIDEDLCLNPEDCQFDFTSAIDFNTSRFRLSNAFGRQLILADSSVFETQARFAEFFRGLSIQSAPSNGTGTDEVGAIYDINLINDSSNLTIYYRIRPDITADFDTAEATFPIRNENSRFHQIERSLSPDNLLAEQQALSPSESSFLFSQQGNLVSIAVDSLPDLSSFGNRIGINRAEFILEVDTLFFGTEVDFDPVVNLLIQIEIEGEDLPQNVSGASLTDNKFVFDITRYVQDVNSGFIENNGFFIRPTSSGLAVNRVVIGGPANAMLRPQLNLTFTSQN